MPGINNVDLTINGHRIRAQGMAHVRDDVKTEDAAAKMHNSANGGPGGGIGADSLLLSYTDETGKAQRVLVWGDSIDFAFRERNSQPDVRLNGQQVRLADYMDAPNTFVEGAVRGVLDGIHNAFDAVEAMAKTSIVGVSAASATALVGSTVWVVASKGAAIDLIKSALISFGPGLATTAGALSVAAIGLVVLADAIKGGFGALQNQPKTDQIASLVDDELITKPRTPGSAPAPAPTPAPVAPAANSPAANTPAANTPASNKATPAGGARRPAPSANRQIHLGNKQ